MFKMTKVLLAVVFVVLCAASVKIEGATRRHLEMIRSINMANLSWNADFTPYAERGHRMLGTVLENTKLLLKVKNSKSVDSDIPASFNAQDKWANCKRIMHVRDQGGCRSDWAVAATSVLTDRLCIYMWSLYNEPISAYHVLSCCTGCGGCESGSGARAWTFFETDGVVTGGDYHSQMGCLPYQIEPCKHVPEALVESECPFDPTVQTPKCPSSCIDSRNNITDRKFAKRSYAISNDVGEIQKEIMTNGPVQASMAVYEDFLYYKGEGVYYHYNGDLLGGLSIKIVGWGTDTTSKKDYWLAVNSWNTDWGDGGTFKIARGTNECGVEANVIAGDPLIEH